MLFHTSDLQGEEKAKTWAQIADAMEGSRVKQSQKCSANTFRKNWRPFIDHAVKLINTGKAHDGNGARTSSRVMRTTPFAMLSVASDQGHQE